MGVGAKERDMTLKKAVLLLLGPRLVFERAPSKLLVRGRRRSQRKYPGAARAIGGLEEGGERLQRDLCMSVAPVLYTKPGPERDLRATLGLVPRPVSVPGALRPPPPAQQNLSS